MKKRITDDPTSGAPKAPPSPLATAADRLEGIATAPRVIRDHRVEDAQKGTRALSGIAPCRAACPVAGRVVAVRVTLAVARDV